MSEFNNTIPANLSQSGHEGGVTKDGERIPPDAMVELVVLRNQLAKVLVDHRLKLHFCYPKGGTLDEVRANIHKNPLYNMGDAIMIVVNEGDFGCLTLAVDVLESKYPEDTNK